MIPVFMTVKHDPPHTYGDCYRCCIASILEVPAHVVPSPAARGFDNWSEEMTKLDDWLGSRGMYHFFIKTDTENLPAWQGVLNGYYILGGKSPRAPHVVVGLGRQIVHDPHPEGGGLKPDDDGMYSIGVIVISKPGAFP